MVPRDATMAGMQSTLLLVIHKWPEPTPVAAQAQNPLSSLSSASYNDTKEVSGVRELLSSSDIQEV